MSACKGDGGLCTNDAEADGYCDNHHPMATQDGFRELADGVASSPPRIEDLARPCTMGHDHVREGACYGCLVEEINSANAKVAELTARLETAERNTERMARSTNTELALAGFKEQLAELTAKLEAAEQERVDYSSRWRSLSAALWDGVREHGLSAPPPTERREEGERLIHAYCGEVVRGREQVQELKSIVSQCAAVAGGVAADSSVEFMRLIPGEVQAAFARLQSDLANARADADAATAQAAKEAARHEARAGELREALENAHHALCHLFNSLWDGAPIVREDYEEAEIAASAALISDEAGRPWVDRVFALESELHRTNRELADERDRAAAEKRADGDTEAYATLRLAIEELFAVTASGGPTRSFRRLRAQLESILTVSTIRTARKKLERPSLGHDILWIDATPDDGYVRRILSAYLETQQATYATDNLAGLPPESQIARMMNEHAAERVRLLQSAIDYLDERLSPDESRRLMELIENPPPPTEKLRELFRQYRPAPSPSPELDAVREERDAAQVNLEKTERLVDTERARAAEQEKELSKLRVALDKVNAIRCSIIGMQGFNFSEHAYPLVAALEEAGYTSPGYEINRKNLGTLIEQRDAAEKVRDEARTEAAAMRVELERLCEPQMSPHYKEQTWRMCCGTLVRGPHTDRCPVPAALSGAAGKALLERLKRLRLATMFEPRAKWSIVFWEREGWKVVRYDLDPDGHEVAGPFASTDEAFAAYTQAAGPEEG